MLLDSGGGLHSRSVTMSLTLSQVREWDTEHLTNAARHWSTTANRWEDAFAQIEQSTFLPGGTPWEGAAATAAQSRAHEDRQRVSAAADQMYKASVIASTAVSELQDARRRALAVVHTCESAGFTVGQDFSLTTYRASTQEIAAAEAEARKLCERLRSRIAELLELDEHVAKRIAAAVDGLGAVTFDDDDDTSGERDPAIQLVDNRTLKEAPPQPPPPDPTSGRLPPVNGADDVKRILDPLQNGGRRGPNGVGTKSTVKEVWDDVSTRRLWDYLTRQAVEDAPPPDYEGTVQRLPDGTRIGMRRSEDWGDTIDVWYPDPRYTKTHTPYEPYFPPLISGPPQLPPPTGMPSAQIMPPQLTHPPSTLPPNGFFEPNGLPPWLQNPSAPGFHTPAQPPTIMPGVAMPDVAYPTAPSPDDGRDLPVMGGALVDAGQAVGSVIVGGVVVIGGLLGTVANPSGQLAH